MKKLFLTLIAITCSLNLSYGQWWGQQKVRGNGDYTTQTRNVNPYDEISVTGSFEVTLVSGAEGTLKIQGESNLLEHLLTEVKGKELKISVERGYQLVESRRMPITIEVPVEHIDALTLTGSGDIIGKDQLQADDFEVKLTGSGDIELDLKAQRIKGKVTGSGDVVLRGSTVDLDCEVTGSGDFQATNLKAQQVTATVSGSGDIEIHASEALQARVQGSGDISYKGNPKKQNFKTFGSGSISSN